MNIENLIGKTISDAEFLQIGKFDDEGWLKLSFTDGTNCIIEADYGRHTGDSIDEHPTKIRLLEEDEFEKRSIEYE